MEKRTVLIRLETPDDQQTIGRVNRAAFGDDDEAKLINALREGNLIEVSLVAEVNAQIVGHILFSPVTIQTAQGTVEALSLAPMAVLPSFQGQGIGSQLVEAGLKTCRERNGKIVLVLGHPEFYQKFGFSPDMAQPLQSPFGGGDSWMALELVPHALTGVEGTVIYSPPFLMFE